MISLACADIPLKAYWNIFDCLRSKRIGRGKYVDRLEKMAAEYFGVKHALAVSNGTLADMIMLATLKEMRPGKNEVIVPAFTFVAQVNAILWAGLAPVFVDATQDYEMDWQQVKITDKTLCVFPAHLLGKECAYDTPKENSEGYPISVLEDCCEAMGGRYEFLPCIKGPKFGTVGMAGAFSMYPSHTITTGEGGLIITNNSQFDAIARSIHNHGKWGSQDFDFRYIGINAKMTNLQAAIGCSLIERIDKVNEIRRRNIRLYNLHLGMNFKTSAPHCFPVLYDSKAKRDSALRTLAENGIEARKLMGCIPDYEPYIDRFGFDDNDYPNARRFANTGLFLPVHQQLTEKQIKHICNVVNLTR